jgi:hypothetical protein
MWNIVQQITKGLASLNLSFLANHNIKSEPEKYPESYKENIPMTTSSVNQTALTLYSRNSVDSTCTSHISNGGWSGSIWEDDASIHSGMESIIESNTNRVALADITLPGLKSKERADIGMKIKQLLSDLDNRVKENPGTLIANFLLKGETGKFRKFRRTIIERHPLSRQIEA